MENNENTQISFDQIKELYKDMLKERAKEKFRVWDREYKRVKYQNDPEYREMRKAQTRAQREKKKAEAEAVTANI
jgi:hypothetical protein